MSELMPMRYDEDRLKRFCSRALHHPNLPKEYHPEETINNELFADAIVGFYLDRSSEVYKDNHEALQVSLSRVSFALNYLQGGSGEELNTLLKTLGKHEGGPTHVFEYALGVASLGARHFRDSLELTASVTQQVDDQETAEFYKEFTQLGELIRQLHDEKRMSKAEAQAFMLLFRQATSSAPASMQARVVEEFGTHLKYRLRHAVAVQPHKREEVVDPVFKKGRAFLDVILKNTKSMLIDDRVWLELEHRELFADPSLNPVAAREIVTGHIGYVINRMYPAKTEQ